MPSIVRSERNIAHRLIEEFMLAANEAVAQYLEKRGIASLHRVHEKPDPKKVLEFEELAQAFGYSLGVDDLGRAARRRAARPCAAAGARDGGARPRRSRAHAADERHAARRRKKSNIRPQHYQRLTREDRRQARGAHSFLPDAALAEAGALRRRLLGHFALAAKSTRISLRRFAAIRT